MGTNYYTVSENIHIGKKSTIKDGHLFTFSSEYLKGNYDDKMIVDEYGTTLTREDFYYDIVETCHIAVKDGEFC